MTFMEYIDILYKIMGKGGQKPTRLLIAGISIADFPKHGRSQGGLAVDQNNLVAGEGLPAFFFGA